MIIANITTWRGQDSEAEHFYCSIGEVENVQKLFPIPYFKKELYLHRTLTSLTEVNKLNRKAGPYSRISLGDLTNRFNSIEEIRDELIKTYPNNDIVTYYESSPFKEMLYIKDSIDLGYEGLGEIWLNVPSSCWKDLLPKDLTKIKVHCLNCSKEHLIEDIVDEEQFYHIEDRTLVKFTIKKRDISDPCCSYPDLVWNIIL